MKRHTEELKVMIGEWLRRDPGRGKIKTLSESLRVSPKTLNNWKRKRPKKTGRPSYTNTQRRSAMRAVAKELRRQGYPGEKAIERALPHVPLRLIREYVALAKTKRRKRMAINRKRARITIKVKATSVILAQDGAHLGRSGKEPVDAQIIKDRASLKIVTASVGPPTEDHVLADLTQLKKSRALPLVWSTDNGSNYCTEAVTKYLEENNVIHLRSLPRTPQHNGAVERAVRELKAVSALGKGVAVDEVSAKVALERAAHTLNSCRYRNIHGATADALDENLPAAYNLVNRNVFYAECRKAMCEARIGAVSWRSARMAERKAIYETLNKYGLIEITTGGK